MPGIYPRNVLHAVKLEAPAKVRFDARRGGGGGGYGIPTRVNFIYTTVIRVRGLTPRVIRGRRSPLPEARVYVRFIPDTMQQDAFVSPSSSRTARKIAIMGPRDVGAVFTTSIRAADCGNPITKSLSLLGVKTP